MLSSEDKIIQKDDEKSLDLLINEYNFLLNDLKHLCKDKDINRLEELQEIDKSINRLIIEQHSSLRKLLILNIAILKTSHCLETAMQSLDVSITNYSIPRDSPIHAVNHIRRTENQASKKSFCRIL